MKRSLSVCPPHMRQTGFGIVAAIFFLLLMAALGIAFVSLGTTQQATAATEVQQTRAYLAARSGLEWGLYNWSINRALPAPVICASQAGTFGFGNGTSLSGFTVTVQCAQINVASSPVVRITATACNVPKSDGTCPGNPIPSSGDYVERMVYADIPP